MVNMAALLPPANVIPIKVRLLFEPKLAVYVAEREMAPEPEGERQEVGGQAARA